MTIYPNDEAPRRFRLSHPIGHPDSNAPCCSRCGCDYDPNETHRCLEDKSPDEIEEIVDKLEDKVASLRAEVQRLTEEARRSDVGRVEQGGPTGRLAR